MGTKRVIDRDAGAPIVFYDTETTGTDPVNDKIITLSAVRLNPDGSTNEINIMLDPQIPISPGATAVHGITNEMVKGKPLFKDVANNLITFFKGCILAGFNIGRFDNVILAEEFYRCGIVFPEDDAQFIDVMSMYHKLQPRTLASAYKDYTGKELVGGHDAMVDVMATIEVYNQMIERHRELLTAGYMIKEPTVNSINQYLDDVGFIVEGAPEIKTRYVDLARKLKYNAKGEVVFAFGKHIDKPVKDHADYVNYFNGIDTFPRRTKLIMNKIIGRK